MQFSKFGKLMFVHACILIICIKLWQSYPWLPLLFRRKVLFKLQKMLLGCEKAVIFEKPAGNSFQCAGVELQCHKGVKVLVVPRCNTIFLSILKPEAAIVGRISV